MNIYIGMTRDTALHSLRLMIDEIERTTSPDFSTSLYGESNGPGGEWILTITNDDMEGRPEVADKILFEIED